MFRSLENWKTSPVAEAVAAGATRDAVEQTLRHRIAQGHTRFDDLAIDPVALSQRLPALVSEPRENNLPRMKAGFTWPEGVSEEDVFNDAIEHPPVACRLYREPNMSSYVGQAGPWADPNDTRTYYGREVLVPESYAERLDQIRRGRASGTYATAPDARLALPEEVLAVLASLPFFALFTRIHLMPGNDFRKWWLDTYGRDIVSSTFNNRWDTTENGGWAWYLWEPTIDELQETLFQWWAERIHGGGHSKCSEYWYRTVREFEGRKCHDSDRDWAHDFAQIILGHSGASLQDYCLAFPVRATLMAGTLDESLALGVDWHQACLVRDRLLGRLTTIAEEVAPLARATLFEWAHAEHRSAKQDAICLLLLMGTPDDIARLPPIEKLEFAPAHLLSKDHVDAFRQLKGLKYLHLRQPSYAVFAELKYRLPHAKVYNSLPSA